VSGFNLSAWAVAHRALVGFLIALLFAAGGLSYSKLGRNEDPSFTVKLLIVTAQWNGATAAETQNQVAERIERKLQDLPHLDHLTTFVRPGFAVIQVNFRDDTPPGEVPSLYYQTRKKLDDLRPSLPQGVDGPFVNDEYTDVFGALFALTAETDAKGQPVADNAELVRAAERIRDRLLHVPGAEKIVVSGEIPRTMFVEFSQARLATLGVSIAQIRDAIARTNAVAPAGLVETGTTRIPVRVEGALDTAAALADIPIATQGRTLRLGDVATISRGYADPPSSSIRHNGQPAVVVAVSTMKGTNGEDFGVALQKEVAAIRADLPAGLVLQQIANQPEVIGEAVGEFLLKFVVALGVVLLVSFASLGFRTGIVVALAVPLTLAVVFIIMEMLGIELQRISLGALILSLGLLVDDAIIAIETMVVKLEEGWDRTRAATFAWTSTAFPMLTGTLVTAAGFLPVGLAKSTSGEYAGGIFWIVEIALLASWVVAVVFTPYLGVLLPDPKKKGGKHHDAIYATAPYRLLRRMVEWSMAHRRLVVIGTVLLFLGSVGGMGAVKQQFFPSSARPELIVDVTLRQGASQGATGEAVAQIEQMLAKDTDVRWFTAYIGAGAPRFFLAYNPALPNDAVATIIMTTQNAEARERVRARLLALVEADGVPPARLHVSRLELGPPVGFPVQFRVVGTDLAAVRHAADSVLAALRATPGARQAQLAWGERAPSVRLALDQARIRQLGLSPSDIATSLQALISGTTATQLRSGTKLIDVVLRAAPGERLDLARLPDLQLPTDQGPVQLGQIARLEPQSEEPILWRRDREPYLTVQAEVQDGLQAPDVSAAAQKIIATIELPAGVRVEMGGAAEESAKANVALLAVFPLMAAAMVLLLMIQLQNLPRALMVLATAPLGVIGAVAALLIADAPFGFVALLGLIALAGMIMRNTIILVDQVRQDVADGSTLGDAILESTVRRARPVILTALAAMLAFIPLSFNVFWGPMALVMIGGLAVATLLTLVFLPALYALSFRVRRSERHVPKGMISKAFTTS